MNNDNKVYKQIGIEHHRAGGNAEMPHVLKQGDRDKKQQQSAYTINTTPNKLVLIVLANKFIKLADEYVVIICHYLFCAYHYTLTQSLPILVGEGREGWGKRKNYFIFLNITIPLMHGN